VPRSRMRVGELLLAAVIGAVSAVVLALLPVPVIRIGMLPLSRPISLAVVQRFLGEATPLHMANVLQGAYVTLWALIYAVVFRPRYPLWAACLIAGLMWTIALVVVFPLAGWGMFGLQFGASPMATAMAQYTLVALLIWGMSKLLLARGSARIF
jgi:hypothetical protein